jgi:hypothetical protein
VNRHTGIEGNELADSLAKEAAQEEGENIYVYDRIPLSTIAYTKKEEGLKKWQTQWERAKKGAICITFFPNIKQRLDVRLPITPEFTAMVSGHGKTRSYLKRFKLTDESKCPCNEGEQTVEHIIHVCSVLDKQRSYMIKSVITKGGSWPPLNNELVDIYLQDFIKFVKSIDFNQL